jgi:hypothetical protein
MLGCEKLSSKFLVLVISKLESGGVSGVEGCDIDWDPRGAWEGGAT